MRYDGLVGLLTLKLLGGGMAGESGLPEGDKQLLMLSGEEAYAAAIDEVVERAQHTLHIFDADLVRGGYGSLARCDGLRGFLAKRRGNQLVMVLHQTDFLSGRCPRLMQLLKTHAHAFAVRQTFDHVRGVADPLIIADGRHYVHRFHQDGARFLLAFDDVEGGRALEGRFQQLMEASAPAVSSAITGL